MYQPEAVSVIAEDRIPRSSYIVIYFLLRYIPELVGNIWNMIVMFDIVATGPKRGN